MTNPLREAESNGELCGLVLCQCWGLGHWGYLTYKQLTYRLSLGTRILKATIHATLTLLSLQALDSFPKAGVDAVLALVIALAVHVAMRPEIRSSSTTYPNKTPRRYTSYGYQAFGLFLWCEGARSHPRCGPQLHCR